MRTAAIVCLAVAALGLGGEAVHEDEGQQRQHNRRCRQH